MNCNKLSSQREKQFSLLFLLLLKVISFSLGIAVFVLSFFENIELIVLIKLIAFSLICLSLYNFLNEVK